MPVAAVPSYLGSDFKDASPGLRFGMYLPLWGINQRSKEILWTTHDIKYEARGQSHQEREVKEENKVNALRSAAQLTTRDKALMQALTERQAAAAQTKANLLRLETLSISPFTTGLGNEHPLENGFAFLNPYGLPYLPGSGVKGVLRQAARELAYGDWSDNQDWNDDAITALFGREGQNGDTEHQRGALSFWDVIPQIKGDALQVEIMTPHQKHYYQDRQSPHDSGQPVPLNFLTVPPGSGFAFHVQCNLALLNGIAPGLAENSKWKELLQAAFEHAFDWCGFGAKTAVGYGAMGEDPKARQQRQEEQAKAQALLKEKAAAERLATLSPEDREWEQAQPVLDDFRTEFEKARAAGAFNPGGTFSPVRLEFMKQALDWPEARSRKAAAELLEASATKDWGRPAKKERWKELQDAIVALKGQA